MTSVAKTEIEVYSREDLAEMLLRKWNMKMCMKCQNEILSEYVAGKYDMLFECQIYIKFKVYGGKII